MEVRKWTADDVETFRQLPTRTHHAGGRKLLSPFPDSFSGKEASEFVRKKFGCSKIEAKDFLKLLMDASVFVPLTFRLEKNFSSKHSHVYKFQNKEQQNLFWLDQTSDEKLITRAESKLEEVIDEQLKSLPSPPSLPVSVPILGNGVLVANPLDMNRSMLNMSRHLCPKYGPIFRINLVGQEYIVVSSPELIARVFEDAEHFEKNCEFDAIFQELKRFRGEGLTTISDGPLHSQCQGLVAPLLMKKLLPNYVATIVKTLEQSFIEMMQEKQPFEARPFFKKCTLRAIGMVAISKDLYDGNKEWAKFAKALTYVAEEAINRVFKGTSIMPLNRRKFNKKVKLMHDTINKLVSDRKLLLKETKKDPSTYDVLDVLLTSPLRHNENGEAIYMSDELVRANLTTVLSAGHSTTTSMLSWAMNFLYDFSLGNHDCVNYIIQEVDNFAKGDRRYVPTFQEIYKMEYITNVLKETLRLQPPIVTVLRMCKKAVNLGGYLVKKGDTIMISILGTQMNPSAWKHPHVFQPDRFLDDITPYSFIPWAGGARQCIGREFALLVGRITMFLLHNRFTINMDPSSRVKEVEHLFVLPEGLRLRATPRRGHRTASMSNDTPPGSSLEHSTDGAIHPSSQLSANEKKAANMWEGLRALVRQSKHELIVATGTKTSQGSTESIADRLHTAAIDFHFHAGSAPVTLNELAERLKTKPTSRLTLAIVLSTYQGNPSASAKEFCQWLNQMKSKANEGEDRAKSHLENVHFFVFGCGNINWAATFQKVARFVDSALESLGAHRITPICEYNEATEDLAEVYEAFYRRMAPALMHSLPEIGSKRLREVNQQFSETKGSNSLAPPDAGGDLSHSLSSDLLTVKTEAQPCSSAFSMLHLGQSTENTQNLNVIANARTEHEIFPCEVLECVPLTSSEALVPAVHIQIKLSERMEYVTGDHLLICPENSEEDIQVLLGCTLDFDLFSIVQWQASSFISPDLVKKFKYPVEVPMTVDNVLRYLVDLNSQPDKQFLVNYATIVRNDEHGSLLRESCKSHRTFKVWLEEHSPVRIADVIVMYPPRDDEFERLLEILPLMKPRPYSIASSPNYQPGVVSLCVGLETKDFPNGNILKGVCSSFIHRFLDKNFKHPIHCYVESADESFRIPSDDKNAVILVSTGTGMAPMRGFLQERRFRKSSGGNYFFFGCRHPDHDLLFRSELEDYEKTGFLAGKYIAYSRLPGQPRLYIQEAMVQQKDLIWKLISDGAYIYVCGAGSRVGMGVTNALMKLAQEASGLSEEQAQEWLEQLRESHRLELDVWG